MAAGSQLSPEDEEALRLMHEEAHEKLPDLRSQGDAQWLADGAQVILMGLQKAPSLNGQKGEVVGFDDKLRRYRVKLASNSQVKVVDKKNICVVPTQEVPPPAPVPPAPSATTPSAEAVRGTSSSSLPGNSSPAAPKREVVMKAIEKVQSEVATMRQRVTARASPNGEAATADCCDIFLRMTTAVEVCEELIAMYCKVHDQKDEVLEATSAAAMKSFEDCVEQYYGVRTWTEMAQDEWNLTRYSIRKHGVLGTLSKEVQEVGQDVVSLGREAPDMAARASTAVPELVRSATSKAGNLVQSGASAAASTAGNVASRSHRHVTGVIEEQVMSPLKRAWHLLFTGFLVCFLVPLFGLRTYAPLNSVVSNLGIVYASVCVCCPPRSMKGRAARAALLLLYPLVTVALPLGLHYWATHPRLPGAGPSWPSWPRPQALEPEGGAPAVIETAAAAPAPPGDSKAAVAQKSKAAKKQKGGSEPAPPAPAEGERLQAGFTLQGAAAWLSEKFKKQRSQPSEAFLPGSIVLAGRSGLRYRSRRIWPARLRGRRLPASEF